MRVVILVFIFCVSLSCAISSYATEEYAQKTGKDCAACHVDPAGGGELTAAGKAYGDSLAKEGGPAAGTAVPQKKEGEVAKKVVHLAAGYLHLLIAILWFGTILYVHLVLKPQYAAGGLPKGEVRVGVLSMVVIGLTGVVLMYFRITSLDILLHTRFGILLMVKVALYLVMVLAAIFVVLFIGPRLKAQRKNGAGPVGYGDLSAEELSLCDGKEGRPAYFAFKGKIYDASGSKLWKAGLHMGRHSAGVDLTEALQLAPHGSEQVVALPLVGELLDAGTQKAPLHVRVFYFLAYFNLTIVFVIVFIVALWRWW
ncbi:cytochrome B5 [Geomonas sp. RF6]|uniref:CopD family protein n=1 Tax=Geomonas sp. RF6 TaxID=2897342 RepID=UPI001E28FD36|nr:CopD family protein [Geomonas sp. RF6]UFS70796.1 cytochrome B5 [Geomonas sp. RF6]